MPVKEMKRIGKEDCIGNLHFYTEVKTFCQAYGNFLIQSNPLENSYNSQDWTFINSPVMLSHWLGAAHRRLGFDVTATIEPVAGLLVSFTPYSRRSKQCTFMINLLLLGTFNYC